MTPSRGSSRPTARLYRTQTRLLTCSSQGPLSPQSRQPPRRSSPPERENDMTAISVTGPGDDFAPVSRENDGQTDAAREITDNDIEMRDLDFENQPSPVPAGASRRSTSSQSRPPIRQRHRDRDHDPLDIISIDSSSSSSRSPPRKTKKQRGQGQLMAYVLVPLPPGARKSDYMPVKQRSRTRQRQTAAKGRRGRWTMRAGRN
ncbi:hypothetical protein EDB89DRAFT_1996218, partial [Lactarius sanguifluus]